MLPTLLAGLEASPAQTDTFIQFYKAHSVGLYRYALSWVKNPHQAEDIAQTAWLQCVQHAQRFFSLPEEKRPAACIGCRSCEAVCPQQLKISEALADFARKLG